MIRSLNGRLAAQSVERTAAASRARVLLAGELALAGRPSLLDRLAARLRQSGDIVVTTSSRPGSLWRAADMLVTAWSARTKVDVAVVEVVGYDGLRRAEILTNMLVRAKVPIVHLLRGASMADAAALEPGRVRRLLTSNVLAVSLSGHLFEVLKPLAGDFEVIADPVESHAYPYRVRRVVAPHIVWLCGDGRVVDPVEAIEALRRLVSETRLPQARDARLTLVAPAGRISLGRVLDLARTYRLEDRVAVAEPLRGAAAKELFAHHDIFVNAGDVDLAPVGIAEAMAAGMCVISFDWGGASYLVAHGVDGLLIGLGANEVSIAIAKLLSNPDLAERLSRAARSRAESMDWSRALPRWRNQLAVASATGGSS